MRSKFSIFLSALLLSVELAQADLSFHLTPATLSGVGTNEIFFAGTLTNSSLTTNFLNDIRFSFTNTATDYLIADTNVFFANVPGILLPGEIYTDVVFGIAINPAIPTGDYIGTVTIQGGDDIFATNDLSSQTFIIRLPPAALSIALSGTNFVIAWPSPPGGFQLQQNSDLATTNWEATTNTPAITNWQNQIFLAPSASNGFYRLKYSD